MRVAFLGFLSVWLASSAASLAAQSQITTGVIQGAVRIRPARSSRASTSRR